MNEGTNIVEKSIQKKIRNSLRIAALREEYTRLVRARKYMQASEVQKKIAKEEQVIHDSVFKKYETERVGVMDLLMSLTEEELKEWNLKVNSILFMCDMVERMQMDCSELIKKYHPLCSFEMFNRLVELGKEAGEQVKFMTRVTENTYQNNFGNYADDMYEMIINKCRSFERRMSYIHEVERKQNHTAEC